MSIVILWLFIRIIKVKFIPEFPPTQHILSKLTIFIGIMVFGLEAWIQNVIQIKNKMPNISKNSLNLL